MITKSFPQPPARSTRNTRRILRLGSLAGVLVLLSGGFFIWQLSPAPTELDLSRTQMSQHGHFEVTYEPVGATVPLDELQSWTLSVTTPDGRGVAGADIEVHGDMPQHGHGLASQPRVTQALGGGRYRVEGLKFQMGGWWVISATITAKDVTDTVRFNLQLE